MNTTTPQKSFTYAIERLNARNLFDLWTTSCIFSCIEYFDNWEHPANFLFPTLNAERINLFQRAILESKAADYKDRILDRNDLIYVFNKLNDATGDRGEFLKGDEDPNIRIRRMLSTMAHQQIRFQESTFFDRIGRTYAMLYRIPLQYADELKQKMGSAFFDFLSVTEEALGLTIIDFLTISYAIIVMMRERYNAHITVSEANRAYVTVQNHMGLHRRAEVLGDILETSREIRDRFIFRIDDLRVQEIPILSNEKLQKFFTLVSRTTKELRELLNQDSSYKQGYIPDRLNPLERFPIVQIKPDSFLVPNLRYFDMATTNLVHYILQGTFVGNEYNQFRGYVQEIYLRDYLQQRLSTLTLIPETSYYKQKNRVDGPDITVLDNDVPTLIAIESKAKRMRVTSRVLPGSVHLQEDLLTAMAAFTKLPGKIADLYGDIPEYQEYKPAIAATTTRKPLAVVVLGEGLYFLGELLNDQVQGDPNHPLRSYPYPYCLLRIEVFERAVEIAADQKSSLYDLLLAYWQKSLSHNISEASTESFSQHQLNHQPLTYEYAQKFFDEMIMRLHITITND